jgi:NADPH:quinone reductase-like Zn-dependent oxidoreductase
VRAGLGAQIDIGPILFGHIHMTGITVGHRSDFVAMNRAITQHGLAPVIDRTFAFDDAPAAYAALSAGDQFGKVAITF